MGNKTPERELEVTVGHRVTKVMVKPFHSLVPRHPADNVSPSFLYHSMPGTPMYPLSYVLSIPSPLGDVS